MCTHSFLNAHARLVPSAPLPLCSYACPCVEAVFNVMVKTSGLKDCSSLPDSTSVSVPAESLFVACSWPRVGEAAGGQDTQAAEMGELQKEGSRKRAPERGLQKEGSRKRGIQKEGARGWQSAENNEMDTPLVRIFIDLFE